MVEVGADNTWVAKLTCYLDLSRLGMDIYYAAALESRMLSVLRRHAGVLDN